MKLSVFRAVVVGLAVAFTACSTPYKAQGYAKLSNTREFEDEYPVVWKAAVAALAEYKVEDKDQEKGVLKTDWIYRTSNEKYVEYQVNGLPRKKYLQTRYKMKVTLERLLGRVKVTVLPQEEIEILKADGGFDDWKNVSEPDSSRANEMVRTIENQILSRPE